jgi:hypothetical protein
MAHLRDLEIRIEGISPGSSRAAAFVRKCEALFWSRALHPDNTPPGARSADTRDESIVWRLDGRVFRSMQRQPANELLTQLWLMAGGPA